MHLPASVLFGIALAVLPRLALAQTAEHRVAAWATIGTSSVGTTEIVTRYQPQLLFGTVEASAASQTVTTGRHGGRLLTAGGQAFVSPRAGLESWMSWDSIGTDAVSSAYFTALRYVSRPPPSNEPVLVDYSQSTAWPGVRVSSARWTTAVNGVVRWNTGGRLSGTVSGGLAIVRVTASADPLGYTTFGLGGHSTLFANEYRLSSETEATTVTGGNVGGSLDVALNRRAALAIMLRQVLAPDAHPTLRAVSIDRSQAGFEPPDAATITAQLSGSTVSIPTSAVQVSVGLKLRF
jgi:hypothetical protein